ncbi:MAG: class I SAM-dependent methyltransferase [Deltaproteobacteria bacterium]|nr:class I SAM-dependent methyltransferase [Deltaproteobacteria bacterium]
MTEHDLYARLTRRAPGSVVFTSSYLTPLPLDRRSTVADVGCGFGGRAAWVARSRCCPVHAFDRDEVHLDYTHRRAEEGGAMSLVHLHHAADYAALDCPDESLDLIMAEGVGFELDALSLVPGWRRHLKVGGFVAVTALGVVNKHPPQELVAPFAARGLSLGPLEELHARLAGLQGFKLIHQVQLPPYAWEEHYQSLGRVARGAVRAGLAAEDAPALAGARAELDWYKRYGRGRLFLQAFILAAQ